MNRKYLSLLLILLGILTEYTNTQTLTENATGQIDGYNYELWKDNGNTRMTLMGGGKFSCEWSNINNALFRIGKKWDCTKTWQQLGSISVTFKFINLSFSCICASMDGQEVH